MCECGEQSCSESEHCVLYRGSPQADQGARTASYSLRGMSQLPPYPKERLIQAMFRSVPSELSALWPLHPMFLPQMVWLVHGLPSQNESSRAAEAMPALTRENIKHYCGHLVNIIEWRNEPVPKCTLSVSAWIPLDDDTRLDLPSSNGQDQTA